MLKKSLAKDLELQETLKKRSKGYTKYPRNIFQLQREGHLTLSEFNIYNVLFTCLVDWDPEHVNTFGSFDYSTSVIAGFLGCSSNTILRNIGTLTEKRYLYKRTDGKVALAGYGLCAKKLNTSRGGSVGLLDMHNLITNAFVNKTIVSDYNSKMEVLINFELADYQGIVSVSDYCSYIGSFKGVLDSRSDEIDIDQVLKDMGEDVSNV